MPWLIALMLVSVSREPLCYSDDWGVVINAGPETCKDVIRNIADGLEPGWREDPFSQWHEFLIDAEDGEMDIPTYRSFLNGWTEYPYRYDEYERRAWITCMVITRDRMSNRLFNYKRRYHKVHR